MRARLIAFYLPQFHPVAENDAAWGKGFTEWTNVTKTTPLFPGHVQPKLPRDLGFYDLRLAETRSAQAEMAREHGIEAFCYWHYWLGNGRRLLDRPFNEVLESGDPDFPFCLGWANHNWDGAGWMGGTGGAEPIIQTYPGRADASAHFEFLARAFEDKRYITINGKPVLVVYRPQEVPDAKNYFEYWRELAVKRGFPGLHIIGDAPPPKLADCGLDGALYSGQRHLTRDVWQDPSPWEVLHSKSLKKVPYRQVMKHLLKPGGYKDGDYPVIIPNWDTTPRLGNDAMIFYDLDPDLFELHVEQTLAAVATRPVEENLVFIRAWNEWAEGNYLEPDLQFGDAYLKRLHRAVTRHD